MIMRTEEKSFPFPVSVVKDASLVPFVDLKSLGDDSVGKELNLVLYCISHDLARNFQHQIYIHPVCVTVR